MCKECKSDRNYGIVSGVLILAIIVFTVLAAKNSVK